MQSRLAFDNMTLGIAPCITSVIRLGQLQHLIKYIKSNVPSRAVSYVSIMALRFCNINLSVFHFVPH